MTISFQPPLIARPADLGATLFRQGYAVVGASQVAGLSGVSLDAMLGWCDGWNDLPPDNYLKDGGRYRRRRHSCFVMDSHGVTQAPHRLGRVADDLKGPHTWFAEAHQFRIDTTDGIGRPTPEGAHRDGVDLVAVFMVARNGVKGGETRVFEADGPNGQRFTLSEPWSLLLLDDERVIHESTPIQPVAEGGYRDTLVVTLRAGGFQGEA
jgi:hypothetical protein